MTKVISNINTLRKILKASDKVINFVPTMGNIHLGHESLIKPAVKKSQISIISIFVNPMQFSEKEDFDNYPRTFNDDIKKIHNLGVNYVFSPNQSFIDNIKESSSTNLPNITRVLCGKDRPGHFHGVVLIVSKLLKLINPDFIYLGEKDYQQIIVIKRLIDKLFIKTKIITHPIVREKNGLVYNVSVDNSEYENSGMFTILTSVDKTKLISYLENDSQKNGAIPIIIDTLNNIVEDGITEDELEKAKGFLEGAFTLEHEDSVNISDYNGNIVCLDKQYLIPIKQLHRVRYNPITLEDVNETAKKYF